MIWPLQGGQPFLERFKIMAQPEYAPRIPNFLYSHLPLLQPVFAARFEAMVQPANSYRLALRPNDSGWAPSLVWHTQEDGKAVEYDTEPARSEWQSFKVNILSLMPLDKEL